MSEPTMSPNPENYDDVEGHGNFSNADKFSGRPSATDQNDDNNDDDGDDVEGHRVYV